jgi:hypothetical protein
LSIEGPLITPLTEWPQEHHPQPLSLLLAPSPWVRAAPRRYGAPANTVFLHHRAIVTDMENPSGFSRSVLA